MSVLLDSANLDDAVRAVSLGFVRGLTTNPTLMRRETDDPIAHASDLLDATEDLDLYYQPTGAYGSMHEEATKVLALDERRITLKLPATAAGAALAAVLVRQGARVALTAAQSPHAMIVAESIGCTAVIPYVDRALRDPCVESQLIGALSQVRRGRTRILAASIKNGGQFLRAFQDGADAVTAPLGVIEELLSHPASIAADQAFLTEYTTPST